MLPPIPRDTSPAKAEPEEAPARIYAGPPVVEFLVEHARPASVEAYREADLSIVAHPDQSRFYDPAYRRTIAAMADHVIEQEGPIFKELVIARIRDVHGFQRARDQIRDIITRAIDERYNMTEEPDGRTVLWPQSLSPQEVAPWRGLGGRSHGEVPLAELASLARLCDQPGLDEEGIVRAMQDYLKLGRLRGPTRDRLEEAVRRMRNAMRAE